MAFTTGWFLLQAARESYVQVTLSHALNGVHVSDVMTRDFPRIDGNVNVQEFVEHDLLHSPPADFLIVMEGGEMGGICSPAARDQEAPEARAIAAGDAARSRWRP